RPPPTAPTPDHEASGTRFGPHFGRVHRHACVRVPAKESNYIGRNVHSVLPQSDAAGGSVMSRAALPSPTHEVENQPLPLEGVNWFEHDRALLDAVEREGGAWGKERLGRFGAWLGQASTIRLGEQANRNP